MVEDEFFSGRIAVNLEAAQAFELTAVAWFFIFRRVDVMNDRV